MIDKSIKFLNEHGSLSAPMLMRKFKLSHDESLILLNEVVEACENVKFKTPHLIYIEGRTIPGFIDSDELSRIEQTIKERDNWLKKMRKKIDKQKRPLWKDLTKP